MEYLDYQDYTNTQIGYSTAKVCKKRPEDRCYKCIREEKFGSFELSRYAPECRNMKCTCEAKGETEWVSILINARGKPVPTKPSSTVYEVTIWDLKLPTKDECQVEILLETEPTYHFAIDFADRERDLDYSNKDVLLKYRFLWGEIEKPNLNFKGVVARDIYLQDFKERIENIMIGCPRVLEEGANSHIGKRKKGYSHVR